MISESEAIAQYGGGGVGGRDKHERTASSLHLSPFFCCCLQLIGDLCWKRKHLEQEAGSLVVNRS